MLGVSLPPFSFPIPFSLSPPCTPRIFFPADPPQDARASRRMCSFFIVRHHSEIHHIQRIAGRIEPSGYWPLQSAAANLRRRPILRTFINREIFDHPIL